MIIILLGAPGAGKGTQAEVLVNHYGMAHLSSGDLLRDERKRGTELGKLAQSYMDRGEYVPDSVMIDMILNKMTADDAQSVVLDGFPRTVAQAEALDQALAERGKAIAAAPYVLANREALLDRLGGRYICRAASHSYHILYNPPKVLGVCDIDGSELYQREDDKRETAERRLEVFFEQTEPVINYYRGRGLLRQINGEQEIADVTRDLIHTLGMDVTDNGATEH